MNRKELEKMLNGAKNNRIKKQSISLDNITITTPEEVIDVLQDMLWWAEDSDSVSYDEEVAILFAIKVLDKIIEEAQEN